MATQLYVDNPKELLADAGAVDSAQVVTDRYATQSRSFQFNEVTTENESRRTIAEINGRSAAGRSPIVDKSRPRKEHGGGSSDTRVKPITGSPTAVMSPRPERAAGFEKPQSRKSECLLRLRESFDDDELEKIVSTLLPEERNNQLTADQKELVQWATGGRTYTKQESAELRSRSLQRYFVLRRRLLADAITAPEVAKLLGTSRQTPHDRVYAGRLIAEKEHGRLLFPTWQFDSNGPDGVVPGLRDVLKELTNNPLTNIRWLSSPNDYLDGRAPIDVLRAGDKDRVLITARALGAV